MHEKTKASKLFKLANVRKNMKKKINPYMTYSEKIGQKRYKHTQRLLLPQLWFNHFVILIIILNKFFLILLFFFSLPHHRTESVEYYYFRRPLENEKNRQNMYEIIELNRQSKKTCTQYISYMMMNKRYLLCVYIVFNKSPE